MPRGGKRRLLPFLERVGVGRTGSGDCVVISLHLRLFRPTRTREKGGRGGGEGERWKERQIALEEGTAISLPAASVGASRSIQQWEYFAFGSGKVTATGPGR